MPTQLAQQFRAELNDIHAAIKALSPQIAEIPWREGGWNRKQIVGHMIDSATNNRQRFVRASECASEGRSYAGPQYSQDAWVAAHGYASRPWETLLLWWEVEHEILASVVDNIPDDRLEISCTVGDDAPVTLRWLIEDYTAHQRWHLAQLTAAVPQE
jgi:hypothetical protein